MKKSKLQGFLKDMENKNKRFSYKKIMRFLDVANYIYLDIISNYKYDQITGYDKSKYLFMEITTEFKYIYSLLDEGKILMATCLLRNVYEEILYIMATSHDKNLDVNVKSNPSDFRDIVRENVGDLISDYFESEDIILLYNHLSKLTHVTNLKEVTSYLMKTKKYNGYISNEIKFLVLLIEYMYVTFLTSKVDFEERDLCLNSIYVANYIEIINMLYYIANSDYTERYLKKYFMGEKNQKYLVKQNEELKKVLEDFAIKKDNIDITIKKVAKELDIQLKESKYIEKVNEIFNKCF